MLRQLLKDIVKKCMIVTVACFFAHQVCVAQTKGPASDQPKPQKLVVRVLDGVTGWPMWFEFPNIWIGSESGVNPRLNIKGEVKFDVRQAQPREIRFLPNWYADCRYKEDVTTGSAAKYSIDEILEKGIVADNVCGHRDAKPVPGVIVFYVRHRTLMEVIAL